MMDGEILCYLKKEKNALNTLIPSWLLFGAVAVLSPSLSVSLSLVASLQVSWDKPPRKTFYWYFFFFYHFPPVFSMSPCFAESLLLLLLLLPFFFPFEETFRSVLGSRSLFRPPLHSLQFRLKKGLLSAKTRLAPTSRLARVSEIWLSAILGLSTEKTIFSLNELLTRWACDDMAD